MAVGGQQRINALWYGDGRGSWLLAPLSWIFRGLIEIRRWCYRLKLIRAHRVAAPVVVVGNLTAGGAGKTPVTIWLVGELGRRGIRAGVVSRGYRGSVGKLPLAVFADSDPRQVGDEPVLVARRCGCPVVVHPDRAAAAEVLLQRGDVDVVIADDGLQHYALARDYEILIVDGERGFGNGRLLPGGPLREPPSRAKRVNRILINGGDANREPLISSPAPRHRFHLAGDTAVKADGSQVLPLTEFAGRRVHAVAGMGNPQRFFDMLEGFGIVVEGHPLADHAAASALRPSFLDRDPVLMTEKDVVKWSASAADDVWYVPVDVVELSAEWLSDIDNLVSEFRHRQSA